MLNKKIVIHVGLPKTGTTSIQSFLHNNTDNFKAEGILIPHNDEATCKYNGLHSDLMYSLLKKNNNSDKQHNFVVWSKMLSSFFVNKKLHTLVISQENLGMGSRSFDFLEFNKMFEGSEIQIIVALRSPEEWLNSLYHQKIRGKARKDIYPDEFMQVNKYISNGYKGLLSKLVTNFPDAVIDIIPFDLQKKRKGGVLPCFLELLNVSSKLMEQSKEYKFKNIKHTFDQIVILKELNSLGIDEESFIEVRKVMANFNKQYGESSQPKMSLFSNPIRKKITLRFTADISYIKRRYGIELPKNDNYVGTHNNIKNLTENTINNQINDLRRCLRPGQEKVINILQELKQSITDKGGLK